MRIRSVAWVLIFAAMACAFRAPSAQASPRGAATPKLSDLEGNVVNPWAAPGAAATVFLFVRTDCPISNSYAPEIRRLHGKFLSRGVAFWLVYLDRKESSAAIRKHLQEFDLPRAALRDSDHALVKLCGARVTPEAAVFQQRRLVYAGRIDDRYVALGKPRAKASTRDLEQAIVAALAGRPPLRAGAPAIGCLITDLQ